jgi:hypothetical protein
MEEYNAMFTALVLAAVQAYVTTQTQAGVTVTDDEAKLFAKNCTVVTNALLGTGVKLIADNPN